jgi:hypothetical protein
MQLTADLCHLVSPRFALISSPPSKIQKMLFGSSLAPPSLLAWDAE